MVSNLPVSGEYSTTASREGSGFYTTASREGSGFWTLASQTMSQQGARHIQPVRLCQNQRSTGSPNTASLRLNRGHIHDPANHGQDGNAWCHVGTCQGSYARHTALIYGGCRNMKRTKRMA